MPEAMTDIGNTIAAALYKMDANIVMQKWILRVGIAS